MVHLSEVAMAEVRQLAKCLKLNSRDVGTLIMLLAKP